MNEKTLCIYHGNCADGFGAAVVVRMALGSHAVEFYAGKYQNPPPNVTGRDVILVDFSYKRPVLLEISRQAKSILILDHHKTAEEDLKDLPDNITAFFDMDRSGAMMAWDYFMPGEEPPQLLRHIQDRDLWRFELPGTREIQACVFSHPYDFETWERLLASDMDNLRKQGEAIERKHFKDINELISSAGHRMMIAGYDVPALNAPYFFSSDAGHILGEGELFAACYWDTPDGREFSLRSAEDGLDVSEIAKLFGGGGHKHAAGFRVQLKSIETLWNVEPN